MAQIRLYQQSFNGGEIADSMFSRVTDTKYQSGLAKCRNFLVEPQGPIVSRPGFQRVLEVKDPSKPPRLIAFTFSADQTMVLEMGEKYIRFHTQGQTLMGQNGQPYEVETPYMFDDIAGIHYVQSADVVTLVHPRHAPMELRRYGATDWRLTQISFGSELEPPKNLKVVQSISSSVSNKEDYTREYAVTSLKADGSMESERSESVEIKCNPYGDGAYNTISWDSVEGAGLYRIYRNQGGVWAYIGQTEATTIVDENISPDASITPPIYDDPFHTGQGINSVTVTNGGSGYGQFGEIVTVSKTGTLEQRWDTQGSTSSRQATIPFQTVWRADGTICRIDASSGSGAVVKAVATPYVSGNYHYELLDLAVERGGSGYPVNGTKVVLENFNPHGVGDRFTVDATILPTRPRAYITDPTGKGCELTVNINAAGQITDIVVVRPGSGYTNPTVVIEGNGGSGATATATVGTAGDYPGAVSYFEGRRWFGGTYNRPNWLWATKSGTESNMGYSLPSQDDDRISASVVARNADRIEHIIPLARMIFLTASAEWLATTKNSDVITQKSLSVNAQSYFGSSEVQPVIVGSTLIYAASRGGHLRECGYSYEAGGYVTADVCLRAPHLFDNLTIVDLAYGKAPYPMVWAVSSDGRLIALTYVPEQQVGAFSTVETDGKFLSCTVVAEGDEDILYAVVRRTIAGVEKVFVERMHERQYTSLEECVYLDCSGTYRGEAKAEISGLTWLEGAEVSILADGAVEPPQVVKDGKITLEEPARVVHVGLPYTCDAQTLPMAFALQDGSYGTSHKKNVISMYFRVVNSSGLKAGPSFDELTEYPARGMENAGTPPIPLTTEIEVRVKASWQPTGQCCIRQDNPLPAKIIGMTTKAEIV